MLRPPVTPDLYLRVRSTLLERDPDAPRMLEWSTSGTGIPDSPEKCAGEVIWIILCAGRSAQAARTIERKVWQAIRSGKPVVEVFGYRAKADAIERAWRDREADFMALRRLDGQPMQSILDWMHSIPFIGDDTQYQLAKNFGYRVCKPDIWLCRLAGMPDRPKKPLKIRFAACQNMCEDISTATGDTVPQIDSMLWLAGNKGFLTVNADCTEILIHDAPTKTLGSML